MEKELRKKTDERMKKAIEVLKDDIKVEYYGTSTPLNQVATLNIPDPKQITIQPWDQKAIQDIEKAILKSDLGLTPMNDGKVIRISIPPLTEERRKDLVKVVKKKGEEGKVAIRNIRRDANDSLKKLEKDKEISEDELKKALDEVQKMTDSYIKKVDETVEHKEQEVMEV
jgi:ribosome recycling factor